MGRSSDQPGAEPEPITITENPRLDRSRLVSAQEEVRRRIASDIHDDTLQVLAEVAIRLDMLRSTHPELDHEGEFGELGSSVRAAMDRLRNLMFDLAPADLDSAGVGSMLRRLLEGMRERNQGLEFRLEDRLHVQPPAEVRVALYRIAQEAINNVRKHARAHTIEVVLDGVADGFRLRIADDGKGFRPGEWTADHYGIPLMRERAEAEGGWLRLVAAPGAGTCVECWLPGEAAGGGSENEEE
jgi:signal transduction histidine kinase